MTLRMADAVTPANLPPGMDAYGAYIDGRYANAVAVQARFPHTPVLTIATTAVHDADVLDVERYDATPAQAPAWVTRQHARGLALPVVYSSQSQMPTVLAALQAAGIGRGSVRVWTAHYTRVHLCSPAACGARGFTADATQWSTSPPNPGYDLSVLTDTFLTPPTPAPAPAPAQTAQEDDMPAILMRAKGDGRWYHVDTTTGTKEYVPSPTVASEEAFLGMKTNNGGPFVEDPAYMASLEDITPGGSPKPEPVEE